MQRQAAAFAGEDDGPEPVRADGKTKDTDI